MIMSGVRRSIHGVGIGGIGQRDGRQCIWPATAMMFRCVPAAGAFRVVHV